MAEPGRAGAPRRGTRPANRREGILTAAEELFVAKGYPNVSMTEIADAVNVRPSALYRHFAGKEDILLEVISRGVRLRIAAITENWDGDIDQMLGALIVQALARRGNLQLWTFHGLGLTSANALRVRSLVREFPATLARWLNERRPELTVEHARILSWAAVEVMTSTSFHEERLSAVDARRVLGAGMRRAMWADLPPSPGVAASAFVSPVPKSRREQLLFAAAQLFARRGYPAVTLDDLGAAVGMAGAIVYTYVDSKQQLLDLLAMRGIEWLEYETRSHLREGQTALERLHAYVSAQARFTAAEPALVRVRLSEVFHLSAGTRSQVDQHDRELVNDWVALLREVHPEMDGAEARVVAMAARMVVMDMLTTRALREVPGIVDHATVLALRVLDV